MVINNVFYLDSTTARLLTPSYSENLVILHVYSRFPEITLNQTTKTSIDLFEDPEHNRFYSQRVLINLTKEDLTHLALIGVNVTLAHHIEDLRRIKSAIINGVAYS